MKYILLAIATAASLLLLLLQFFSVLEAALSRYFPAEMPFNDGRQNNNKQKYMKTHLPR
jgi:hypothetical protein